MTVFKSLLALLVLAVFAARAHAADDGFVPSGEPAETITVSLLTFQPGTEYWQRFGHNALLLRDAASGRAITYNYGLFDFRQKNFFLNFARGHMVYRVAPNALANDLPIYAEDGRWAIEQRLALTPAQRGWLRDYLEWNVQREHADYRYDYFLSNCSTRVRDALDRALAGALHQHLQGRAPALRATYRSEALRLISPDAPMFIGMDLALGPTADRAIDLWQQSFAPLTLMQALRGVEITNADGSRQPLVTQERYLLPRTSLPDPPDTAPSLSLQFLLAGLLGAALISALIRERQRSAWVAFAASALTAPLWLAFGLGGIVLAALWGLTEHWAGWANENLLLLNPLCLLLLPAALQWPRRRWQPGRFTKGVAVLIAVGAVFAALLRMVPGAVQANLHWVLLLLPMHVALAGSVLRSTAATGRAAAGTAADAAAESPR